MGRRSGEGRAWAGPHPADPSPLLSRSLGVHCSKVRSLTLDSWEPELLKVWGAGGGLARSELGLGSAQG